MEMGLRRTAAVPAGSGFRGVFCAVLAAGLLALGCDDPGRIVGEQPQGDVFAPEIRFISPAQDTTYNGVRLVTIYVRVADPSGLDSVTAWVTGGLNFTFGSLREPTETALYIGFGLPDRLDPAWTSDSIEFRINASDRLNNRTPDRVLHVKVQ
jgi:hypothetical protein